MKNILVFPDGYRAVITYDPDIEMFRGEFIGLNGGADFYAKDIDGLKREGLRSLEIFLKECAAHGIQPRKHPKPTALVLDAETYSRAQRAASLRGTSLQQFISDAVRHAIDEASGHTA